MINMYNYQLQYIFDSHISFNAVSKMDKNILYIPINYTCIIEYEHFYCIHNICFYNIFTVQPFSCLKVNQC